MRRERRTRIVRGSEDIVWFKMDAGRKQRAEPRWIMPLLCRRGHVTRSEIGAIRIGPDETHFQIPRKAADKFMDAVAAHGGYFGGCGDLRIVPADGPPPHPGRPGRKPRHESKPHRKGWASS